MFHVKHEGLDPLLLELGVELTPSQVEQLDRYAGLLADHGIRAGLIARTDADRLWERHIGDALRGVPEIPEASRRLCDLGSGAGLPGLVLAVARPELEVVLTEPRRTKVAFLELVLHELELDRAQVFAGQAERVRGSFDVCSSRAMASVALTWKRADPLLSHRGRLIYWAGGGFSPNEIPSGLMVDLRPATTSFAGSGPLVIMGRQ